MAAVGRWSLFGGHLCNKAQNIRPEYSGRYRHVVAIWRWSLAHVRLYFIEVSTFRGLHL